MVKVIIIMILTMTKIKRKKMRKWIMMRCEDDEEAIAVDNSDYDDDDKFYPSIHRQIEI
jgi:hypothetical protein